MPCNPCNHPHVAVLANGRGKLGIAGQNGLGHGRGGVLRYKMSRLGQQQAVMFRKGGLETLAFVRSDERVAPAPAQQYPAIATLCEILLDTREEFGAVEQLTREPIHGGPALGSRPAPPPAGAGDGWRRAAPVPGRRYNSGLRA